VQLQTALENYNALVDFFTNKFPELKSNSFYITGESYAGIYLPTLGEYLIKDKANFPNFKVDETGKHTVNSLNSFARNREWPSGTAS
jgi:carboxypeptidase C (cathepsin A)